MSWTQTQPDKLLAPSPGWQTHSRGGGMFSYSLDFQHQWSAWVLLRNGDELLEEMRPELYLLVELCNIYFMRNEKSECFFYSRSKKACRCNESCNPHRILHLRKIGKQTAIWLCLKMDRHCCSLGDIDPISQWQMKKNNHLHNQTLTSFYSWCWNQTDSLSMKNMDEKHQI